MLKRKYIVVLALLVLGLVVSGCTDKTTQEIQTMPEDSVVAQETEDTPIAEDSVYEDKLSDDTMEITDPQDQTVEQAADLEEAAYVVSSEDEDELTKETGSEDLLTEEESSEDEEELNDESDSDGVTLEY